MLKSYKYRIFPTSSQKDLLEQHFGSCRFIYNLALETKQYAYISNRKNVSCFDLMKQIPDLKKECQWLRTINAQSLQQAIVNLDKAFTSFFKGNSKYPSFKHKHSLQSFSCPQRILIDFDNNKISFPKFKDGIRIVFDNRNIEGAIRNATFTKTPANKYFVSILTENDKQIPKKAPIHHNTTIGIDLGIKSFICTSNKEKIENPKFLNQSLPRLKALKRRLSKKQTGSKNTQKANLRLAIAFERVANQKKDFLHKLSSKLIRENQTICIEDLNVIGMVKNHNLAQSIMDSGWSEFVRMLKYKGDWYGKNILQIGRFEPSSKLCSTCGVKNSTLLLSDREWTCPNCGAAHDRDVNAAVNIKEFALRDARKSGRGTPAGLLEALRTRKPMKEECVSGDTII